MLAISAIMRARNIRFYVKHLIRWRKMVGAAGIEPATPAV